MPEAVTGHVGYVFTEEGGLECCKGKSCVSGFNRNDNPSNDGLPSDTEECGQAY